MPWNAFQGPAYGDSFLPWTEESLRVSFEQHVVRKSLANDHGLVQDMFMYKIGTSFMLSLLLLDASHSGATMFCPAMEQFTVAVRKPNATKIAFV